MNACHGRQRTTPTFAATSQSAASSTSAFALGLCLGLHLCLGARRTDVEGVQRERGAGVGERGRREKGLGGGGPPAGHFFGTSNQRGMRMREGLPDVGGCRRGRRFALECSAVRHDITVIYLYLYLYIYIYIYTYTCPQSDGPSRPPIAISTWREGGSGQLPSRTLDEHT